MSGDLAWTEALQAAAPGWLAIVRHAGWHAPLLAAMYAGLGLLCMALGRSQRRSEGRGQGWRVAGVVLAVIAVNDLFALDQLLVLLMREIARQQGWYGARREWQGAALAALAMAAWLASFGLRARLSAAGPAARWLAGGATLLVLVSLLRLVSLHATDALLQARIAGISTGRAAELLGLALVALAVHRQSRGPAS